MENVANAEHAEHAKRAEHVDIAELAELTEHAELPPIYCPFPPAVHPHTERVHRRAVAWIRESGICRSDQERAWANASHSADFFGRFAPGAEDDRLLATSLWVYWAFAFDDIRCDHGPLATRPGEFAGLAVRVQRAVEAPSNADTTDRFIPPLQDIARRLRAVGTPTTMRRFAVAHRAWLSGVTWQIGNRARGHMPDLDEYLAMRLLSAGGEIPGGEFDRPVVRALTEMAIAVAGLDNDRHSVRKEALRGHAEQNIYTVLMRHRRLAPADAVAEATALRDRLLNRFRQLLDRVLPGAGAELRTYLAGLCHGIRGNAEWGLRVPRYLSTGRLPDGFSDTPVEWAEKPSDPRTGPPPTPSVSWWWDGDLV